MNIIQACRRKNTDVNIWFVSVLKNITKLDQFFSVLSRDELGRSKQYSFQRDRECYVIAKGYLRILLGCFIGVHPKDIQFQYNFYGKPYIQSELDGIQFNLSHSGEYIVVAITEGARVGVDIEKVKNDPSYMEIAKRYFSKRERTDLLRLPESQRNIAFFKCWTRKESFIKASGKGLSIPLESFDVAIVDSEQQLLIANRYCLDDKNDWIIRELVTPDGYKGALTVESHSHQLNYIGFL